MNQQKIGELIYDLRKEKNMTQKQLADLMNISDKTVRNHISNVILKLNVNSRTQAVIELLRCKQINLDD